MKIAIVLGTRPEIIKMASVMDEIQNKGHELLLIHTGQHYDKEMSENFFLDLKLPKPNYNIHVGSGSHGKQTGKMMEGIEEVLLDEKPDIVLVQGDTNAVLAGALVAVKLHIPVGHVEAGLRSFDETMPEEINRLAADVSSKLYFVPTEESAINLAMEGISRKRIFVTGNTVVDACFRNLKISEERDVGEYEKSLADLDIDNMENIVTLTMHRAENVDFKDRLLNIIEALEELDDTNIIFPMHPRTKKTMENFGLFDRLNDLSHVHIIKPVGYLDFLLLTSKSTLILTDSGGLQEEAITLDVPALTLRYNTERPETVTAGGNILVGSDKEAILKYARKILDDEEFRNSMKNAKNPYGMGNAAELMIKIIEDADAADSLKLVAPDEVMASFTRKMKVIDEDISVKEYEDKNNALIKIAFEGEDVKFPFDDLNLKGKTIILEDYNN
ncbi:non-hydrolyzing UDP-N-acetylglucosamine 2-epimerase [Methanobrevibacter sp.]|jgi:UDP-N-acetylglucosamine 2-epimerase (non-hydrolysing)|uniref:non-hydrolyzing UDP-N-acetylglucosamine 2-epimerase n=1 Tax=Methanobrevibacter sp. TaxID=66852 RepID=UPI002706BB49|nr:UDP-N-acetylglucosamine 2-epimerase (non-hydrolyzing) [Methanobrevibacter sp.]MDO5821262.1 UDP-N-acetylglucosamine 2-epimerase (non-hydrolyzing) [Methanobrevibacter sp.]MEE0925892.1 UDP-N-acetylglucosamine 2-epimerase (non-hydrolyzing) [Methanobrevibacter sp.]MEE1335773.1 UDP-N-acetylglucosamine 2-epimerase (non-hydrolyzing) [Methanobrevibacter sp.]